MNAEPQVYSAAQSESKYSDEIALVEEKFGTDLWKRIDAFEEFAEQLDESEPLPLNHVFTPGIYVRQCFMKRGQIVTTRIHLTEHVYLIQCGVASVLNEEGKWETFYAGYSGVTKPGTRRVLLIHEDCIWATVHANPKNETDPDNIVREITFTGGKYASLGIAAATVPILNQGDKS